MPPINLLIKPASSCCNLRCKYCFYHDLSENRLTANYGMMDIGLLEEIVKKALDYADQICTFAFQGGEPTLRGLDFYKELIEFENKYNTKNVKINNLLQTNGFMIDEEWATFLAENNFLVGISLDGPKEIHDLNRVGINGEGSFNRTMTAIRLFENYHVEYNILFVVNGYAARHANKIYNFFKKHNFNYLQFIPCLDPIKDIHGSNEFSLNPKRFTYFLKSFFDLWYEDVMKGKIISIRYFDNITGIFMGYKPEACGMLGHCQCQLVVEANGAVYPCDFYVIDEWLLGNIRENGFDKLQKTDVGKKFIELSVPVSTQCRECKWFNICRGGCRRDREPFIDGQSGKNYYCNSYKEFFQYSEKRFRQVAAMFRYSN